MKDNGGIFGKFFKPTAVAVAIIVSAMVALNAYFGFETHDANVRRKLFDTAKFLAQSAQSNPQDAAQILKFAFKKAADNPALRLTLLDSEGKIVLDSESSVKAGEERAGRAELVCAMDGRPHMESRISSVSGREVLFAARPVFDENGKVVCIVRAALPQFDAEFEGWTAIMRDLATGGTAILFLWLVLFVVSKHISKKAEKMEDFSKAIEHAGDEIPTFSSDIRQFSETAKSLSEMARNMRRRMITLNKRSSELSEIFANMKECVFICNVEGRFLKMNAASGKFFNVDEGGVRDRMVEKIISNRTLLDFIDSTFKDGETSVACVEFPENGGKVMNITGSILPYDAKAKRAAFVMNDITEIRALEKMRRTFVAGVSHELKTPITSVKGFVEALRDTPDGAEKIRILDIIERESERMNSLVDDMLLLSKLEHAPSDESKDFETMPLAPLLRETAEIYRHISVERGIEVGVVCDESLSVRGNRKLMALAISNLVSNAIKHSPDNTKVEIRANKSADNVLEISVSDNGQGIAPEHLSHIFERFYRVDNGRARQVGGTGLGLALVKHIAILHGAKVSAESKLGSGSVFKITKKLS